MWVSVQQLTVTRSISTQHWAGVSLPEQKKESRHGGQRKREDKQTATMCGWGCEDTWDKDTVRCACLLSLFRHELQYAAGGGDLAHGLGASLVVASRRGRLVVNVDTGVRSFHWRRARRWAKKTCKAGERERERDRAKWVDTGKQIHANDTISAKTILTSLRHFSCVKSSPDVPYILI